MRVQAASLGCSPSQVGIIVAGLLIGATFFNIPAGAAVSRFGSRVVIAASMVICSAAACTMLAAEGFYGLLIAQLFAGLGSSCFNVGVSSFLRCEVLTLKLT